MMKRWLWVLVMLAPLACLGQAMPGTVGETLSGKKLAPSEAVRGHAAVLIFGFSKAAGDGCGAWAKAVRGDAALAGVTVLQVASLESAPGFVRGMIKGAMKKGMPAAEQDQFIVLTQDEKQWRGYFGVTEEKDPYVELLDASGKVLWHGHGDAAHLEPLLRGKVGSRD